MKAAKISSKSSSSSSQSLKLINEQDIDRFLLNNQKDLFDQLIEEQPSVSEVTTETMECVGRAGSESAQRHSCRCTKIDCLKMYCECFAKGKMCTQHCECVCCANGAMDEAAIFRARQLANLRHPGTFKNIPALVPVKRCTCKKSSCRKNYCECYRANIKCTEECECLQCQNGKPHHHSYFDSPMEIEVQA